MIEDEKIKELVKKYLEESKKEIAEKRFPSITPMLFRLENLPFVLIGSVILLILIFMFGGLALANIIQTLTNPYLWASALIISAVFKPYKTIIIWSLLIALGIWGYGVYQEVQTITSNPSCQIPIIGWIICSAIFAGKITGWIWSFAITLLSSFIALYTSTFLFYNLTER